MSRKRSDIMSGLIGKGFSRDERSKHTYFIYWTVDGKKTAVFTHTSRGTKYKTLGDDLVGSMAKQCRLNKKKFFDLVDCPLSRAAYEEILDELGVI